MDGDGEGNLLEIMDLARTLRQEQLFIQNEQAAFATLTESLALSSSQIAELAYICAQQRQNLNDLITSRPETGPSVCCSRANCLENTKFIDANKVKFLKYEYTIAYVELFNYLYRTPYVLAMALSTGDRIPEITPSQMNSVNHTIATGLYGNAIHTKDVETLLKLLRELIEIQIAVSENPRRMIRAGSSSFARLFHRLNESMFSAKIFLTAALYEPLMNVLVESETMLDVDPNKVVKNFNSKERLKRFGEETAVDYQEKVQKFREEIITKLHKLASSFISNITSNWSLFPSTLRWLIQIMCHQLKQAQTNEKDINEIITDMVFTHFICPAIVSPDILGIIDAPISELARFNLMQIGQIIQMLALMKYQDVDPKFSEVYQLFDANIVSKLLDLLLVSDSGEDVVAIRSQQSDFERAHLLVTQSELNTFIEFFRVLLQSDELALLEEDRLKLKKIIDHLPEHVQVNGNGGADVPVASTSPTEFPLRSKHGLINLGKSTKNKLSKSLSNGAASLTNGHSSAAHSPPNVHAVEENEPVLVFRICISDDNTLQPLTEEEVLKMNAIGQEITDDSNNIEKLETDSMEGGPLLRPLHAKTTRFSLSHDDASIGNSDNLEAVSEAPSNHSVTSSLELEENDQNDNLSDMVSANVSGRGTPNISGRDTPSSQVTDGESVTNVIPTPQMAKLLSKARSDIEDKFCKFEIKKLMEGDETVSIISDTWSTDVLASDSETLDANERDRNFSTPLIPSAVVLPGDNNFDPLSNAIPQANYLEGSETRSESNWSTDVLVSDSEKLAEVDTDDNLSITAKSDITNASVAENLCTPDSPFFAPRAMNVNYNPAESPAESVAGVPNGEPSQDSAFFDGTGLQAISSLARSSVRTTNQYSGENSFQQNYKSDKESFLSPRMRRQNSAESSISSQSLNMEDKPSTSRPKKRQNRASTASVKDLIDFSDFDDAGGAVGIEEKVVPVNEDEGESFSDIFEAVVVHRRSGNEQRSPPCDDGRRNGIRVESVKASESINSSLVNIRRHQSLNYENHEIIVNKNTQRITMTESSVSDDVKSQQQQNHLTDEAMITLKTEELTLNGPTHSSLENVVPTPQAPSTSLSATTTAKPNKSTGAIPKSISFDASADKAARNNMHMRRLQQEHSLKAALIPTTSISAAVTHGVNGSGIFNKLKQNFFKNRRGNKQHHATTDDFPSRNVSFCTNAETLEFNDVNMQVDSAASGVGGGAANDQQYCDNNEDILAKYRTKAYASNSTTNSNSTDNSCHVNRKNSSDSDNRIPSVVLHDKVVAFNVVKRKIRKVLSKTDLHTGDFRHTTFSNASPLLTYMQIQMAQAINLQNSQQISFVSEAIRCLATLEPAQHQQLMEELQSDILKRQSYLQYLMRYRQNLLLITENISQFEQRLRSETKICNRHLVAVCVRMFLEKREARIETFHEDFIKLTAIDDRIYLLDVLMKDLMLELGEGGSLHGMAEWQLQEARKSIERALLQRLYQHVMFPNEDVDMHRDKVLNEHIRKLQQVIKPSHPALRIPPEYLTEAPWTFAQQQLYYISAYTTPQEKLQCVIRCITNIMNLLQMACDRVPAADDLLPVLIYVVIKANPPYLLSTIEYVTSFIGEKLDGEEQFYWTQFCSVVQFIKTMDY
ncbi:receptor-mediated endocytosis protein 6 homolog [Eupeodes corollae]|uniref:receptor-mediated endocytosis protein 6 homolog n=1 Tax=Eupeodes corollae TaxID=290404 RepID=UPI002491244F|nr:receptor-mediated endocytosis protein 6 homolog [Eupeodes corollae]